MKPHPPSAALALAVTLLTCQTRADDGAASPPPDLLGHWSFDQHANSSVGGWTATPQGGAQTAQPGAAVGKGCYRNGAGDGFLLTNLAALQSNSPQTVSFWIKTDSNTGSDDAFFGWGEGGYLNHYDVGLKGKDLFFLLERSSAVFPMATPLNDGQWHHLLISRTASGLNRHSIHLDGKPLGSPTQTFGGGYASPIRIGTGYQRTLVNGGPPARDFNGMIDDFAYFNSTLGAKDAALIHGLARLAGVDAAGIQQMRLLAALPAGAVAEAGGHQWTKATGLSGTTGDYGGSIQAGDAWIALDAEGGGIRQVPASPPPAANPLALEQVPATITIRSGDRGSFPFQLRNNGGSSVDWKLNVIDPSGDQNSLEAVLSRIVRHSPKLLDALPPLNDFTGGVTGTQINNTPFNGGAILSSSMGGPLAYSDGIVTASSALGTEGRYFSLKLPGLLLFGGDFNGPEWFESGGQTTGYTSPETQSFDFTHAGRQWKAFAVKRSFNTGGTGVNQLFLIEDGNAYLHPISTYADWGMNARVGFTGKRRILHAIFTVSLGANEPWKPFENLSRAMLDLVSGVPSGLAIQPAAGNLVAGGVASPSLAVDAQALIPGTYPLWIDAQPAAGGAEPARAPITLTVDQPSIRFSQTSVDRAGIFGGPSETVTVATESATGNAQAWTASLIGGGTWITLNTTSGTTPQSLGLRFTPPATGLGGIYRASLEIRSGTNTFLIPISYALEGWNVIDLVADPLRDNAYVLNSSDFGGAIAVISQGRRTLRKVIRVGTRPADIAFSTDGSAIYVLCAHGPEIHRIDTTTLEVTAKRSVPGTPLRSTGSGWPSNRLAVGPNGRILYTESGYSPSLFLLDFESGQVLDKLTYDDIPPVGNTKTGFSDIWFDPNKRQYYFTRLGFGSSGYPRIGRIEMAGDQLGFAEEWIAAGSDSTFASSRISSDLDGQRFFIGRILFEKADMNNGRFLYDSQVSGISAYGHLILTQYALHDATTGQKLADLPFQTGLASITANQEGVLYHSGVGQFQYWSIPAGLRPPTVAIRPEPPGGGAIEQGEDTLRWSSLPLVDGYRIYLGTDQAAVASAQPGSPLDRGIVTSNSYTMNPAPTSGTFYWRIDAVRGATAIPGTVHAFSVAPFRITPGRIDVTAPHGALPQRVTLAATDDQGNPVAWSASSTSAWIKFPNAAGAAGVPLAVDLDPAGLALGSHTGTVKVTGAGLTLEIPVVLQLFQVDLRRMRPDPNRPVVYGLQTSQANGQPGFIIPIDAATGKYISAIPLEKYANDFAVHPIEDRLYVALAFEKRIQVFDLKSGGALPSIRLSDSFGQIHSIAPGRNGRIIVDASASSSSTYAKSHLIDSANGALISEIDGGYSSYSDGACASSLAGDRYYRASLGRIQRVDITTDTPVLLESGDSSSSENAVWRTEYLAVSRDGSRVLSDQIILTSDLRRIASVESNAHAITGDGQLVAGPSGIHWADTGFKAANLPISIVPAPLIENPVMLSSDDRYLLVWDYPNRRVLSYPLASLVNLPGPQPRPGQQLAVSPASLSWGGVTGAMEYQVFLGTSQSAVNSAGIGSPLRIGSSQTNSLALTQPLAHGYRYYWRVDSLTPSGSIKGTVHFFDLPFQSSGNPLIQPGNTAFYSPTFGSIAAGPDGVAVHESPAVKWFEFDWMTGTHRYAQDLRDGNSLSSDGFEASLAAGPDLLIAGNPRFDDPANDAGAAFIHRRSPDGNWYRANRLADGSSSHFGNAIASEANQLLIQQGSSWETSGKVFPYFEWPDWRRGPELVPTPREQNDFFGASISLAGTRALIGAPGSGGGYNRRGAAFVFEYDAPTRKWVQRTRLLPSQGQNGDYAGMSTALAGNHAAIGSGRATGPFVTGKVHVFNRRPTGAWVQAATLNDPDPLPASVIDPYFGTALAIHGDILFVSSPYAEWRGQRGGVVYPYRYNGTGWDMMAPIVPPPGGERFGDAMEVHNGWLFITRLQGTNSNLPDEVLAYRIADTVNRQPLFVSKPPVQVVSGMAANIDVEVDDPDGNSGLVFGAADLPPGLQLQNLGNGRASITGTPSDPAGTERWLRISVTDAQGVEAVQTSLVTVLSADLPQIGSLPGSLVLRTGENLVLSPAISGSGPFQWHWQRDGNDLPDGDAQTLVVYGVTAGDAGRYKVTVNNAVGSATSGEVAVTVIPADRFAGDWNSFGSGNDRDGHQPATLGRHRFQWVWQTGVHAGYDLNPVAIAEGRVFVTPLGRDQTQDARAYDLRTGSLLWSRQFNETQTLNSPSWHNGRIYLQRTTYSDGGIWCLDAATGTPVWNTNYSGSDPSYGTPVADHTGVYLSAGRDYGVFAYDLAGNQRFLRRRFNHSPWMAALSNQRLFTWDGNIFTQIDPVTGYETWFLDRGNRYDRLQTTPLVRGSRAYVIAPEQVLCLDINARRTVWEKPLSSTGSPAFGGNRLFVLSGTKVFALSPDDGSELITYASGANGSLPLQGQPLVLNDHLIASNDNNTFVFEIDSARLIQTIPHGGHTAYSAGYLLLAGQDRILRAYFANAAPSFAATMPGRIDANATGDSVVLPLGPHAIDPDSGDVLTWSITAVSRPELFRTLSIHPQTGDLTVVYNPWQQGSSSVSVGATDPAGNLIESTIMFSLPDHPPPGLVVSTTLTLNRQTGNYEQVVSVTNKSVREIAGYDLLISGLPTGVRVMNATGQSGGTWSIRHHQPLAAGATSRIVVEYYTPVRGTPIAPRISVRAVFEPVGHAAAPSGGGISAERCIRWPDGSVLIEFASKPGALYEIHYSNNGSAWMVSPVRIRASGNRLQWIDGGPPRTETSPSREPCRFYRARLVPEP